MVENLSVNPKILNRCENAYINVTIANRGKLNESNVTLVIYDCARRHIEDLSLNERYCGFSTIAVERENATAMRLYLDLAIEGGEVCIYDSKGREIECYNHSFHGWTPWILGNKSVVKTIREDAYAKVSKVYYLEESSEIFTTSIPKLDINETVNISANWTASSCGERFIIAIIDPENSVPEYNESNNNLAQFITVQTADLKVCNISFRWLNGSQISEKEIIKHGDNLTITANVTNIGVENASEFYIQFLVDDIPIKNETIPGLAKGSIISVNANWTAIVGEHVIKVEADYEDK
ncbi:MAG: hypothetical protein MW690_001654 [Methanophagales archaeon]|nr:hypothetical protein [Methanophagales archaeon]MCU4140178.1 hypothetical protein [Methanophagales archaeon]